MLFCKTVSTMRNGWYCFSCNIGERNNVSTRKLRTVGGSEKRNRRCNKVQSRGRKVDYGLRAERERERDGNRGQRRRGLEDDVGDGNARTVIRIYTAGTLSKDGLVWRREKQGIVLFRFLELFQIIFLS